MTYFVRIKGSAAKELKRIDRPIRVRLVEAIDGLAENPLRGTALKGELKGLRRMRVGEYALANTGLCTKYRIRRLASWSFV